MPLPQGLAKFNRVFTNRITRPAAAHLAGFGVLHHTGRISGTSYRTPLNAWRQDQEILVALTYGSDVDWLKNSRAADSSIMVMNGDELRVGPPTAIPAEDGLSRVPKGVRLALDLLDVDGFVVFPLL
jgi:deazaflavin-dependent oxidoreductase (nitroreductase family)